MARANIVEITSKVCSKCKERKSLAEFYQHKGASDGLYSQCKLCQVEQIKRYEAVHPDKKRAWTRKAAARWNKKKS